MPSAPPYLQEMFDNDSVALAIIGEHYSVGKGFVIRPRTPGYKATTQEEHALDYLWLEWDFAFEGC